MGILTGILNALAVLASVFLICLILIQRGKGGGLAGAFGGMGGSSAFGTKAGDVFTKVTMCVAAFWIVLSMLMVILANRGGDSAWGNDPTPAASSKVSRDSSAPGSKATKGLDSGPAGLPLPKSTLPAPASAPADAPAIPAAK
ncbi:preprotein translocase subunit SecG [Singulisphaera sp. PoT]|uniref:preprotein translocase subunit SecG n=1 Tax=Singulisphaera sp. PoT TaxID=3411797 RepID=UPI003BF56065